MKNIITIVFILFISPSLLIAQQQMIGDFIYHKESDYFTDEDLVTVITLAEDGEGALAWGCDEYGLKVMLHVGSYMGGDRNRLIKVRHRFDSNEPSDFQYWRLYPGHNEMAGIRTSNINRFTREAIRAYRVVIEAIDPMDGASRRYRMSLRGFRRAIDRLPCAEQFH